MKISRANDIGVRLQSEEDHKRIRVLMAYPEGGSVLFWVHVAPTHKDKIDELLAYLTPQEAMALASGLERCAIAALKESA